jgi:hypothetical protein
VIQNLFNVQQGNMASQAMDASQAEELAKTMTVGHAYLGAPGSLVGGAAMQMESIDSVLRSVTYDSSHIKLWSAIPQDRAYSLVEQYVRTNSYGDGGSPYIPEAGSPSMNDSEYNRHAQKVVFFATRRGVSLPSTLVRMNFGGDIESKEAEAGTLWMLEKLERELYKGLAEFSNNGVFDGAASAIAPKLSNLNLAGIEQQIRAGQNDYTAQSTAFDGFSGADSVIYDRAGELIDETVIEDLANTLIEQFGHPNELHTAPKQISDLVKQFYPKERVNQLGMQDARAGYVVRTMATTAGDISLQANVFLKPKDTARSSNARAGVPNAPVSATAALATDGDSKLKSGETYIYQVTAANEQGEGASFVESTALAVDADAKNIKLTIVQPAGGAAPTHYAVYRTAKSGAGARKFVGFVARQGASTVFVDRGHKTEGGATAYMLDLRSEVMVWRQLAPLMRLNLAQVSMAKEFILWLAGCVICAAPRKLGIIENIGKA